MSKGDPQRRDELFRARLNHAQRDTDQLFFWLLLAQWLVAIAIALFISPYAWAGQQRSLHFHVQLATCYGAVINALPLVLIRKRPGRRLTRHVVAGAQMLWSAILIDLTGGRIETHFHVFGSLAFLAYYLDSGVLITGTLAVVADHLVRGLIWPEAVYGIANPEWWRFLEHAGWVSFEVAVLMLATQRTRHDMVLLAEREATLEQTHAIVEQEVKLRTGELGESLERYRALIENTNTIPWELDSSTGQFRYIAPQAARFFGCTAEELQAARLEEFIHPDDRGRVRTHMLAALDGRNPDGDSIHYRMITGDRRLIHVRTVLSPYAPGAPLRGITFDVSKQTKLEGELRQAQKLESVGKLAAGIAHEINTPVQFVSDSIHFVKRASDDLFTLLAQCQRVLRAVLGEAPSETGTTCENEAREAERLTSQLNLPQLTKQVPHALELALEGVGRVAEIVRSMKEFAYPHTAEMVTANLNRAIQSTLTIARTEYRHVAELDTHFGEIPFVRCHIGDINQVVLNIVVNAAQAIAEKKTDEAGKITLSTYQEGDDVVIAIADSGCGIPEHLHESIFDPFFTTKEVGSGTGQGLAIARTIVVDRHQGALWFDTRAGVGTTFYVRLPIAGFQELEKPAA
jgi:PAS domain S-box-containing protein